MSDKFISSVHNYKSPASQKTENDKEDKARGKLQRNVVICCLLVLSLVMIKGLDNAHSTHQVASSELVMDEDLGKLKFVSDSDFTQPIEGGEVVSVFSENGISTQVRGKRDDFVRAVVAGEIIETGDGHIRLENYNGTVTQYDNITPAVSAGEQVLSGQVIGYLNGEELELTTVSGTGYINTLDEQEINSMGVSCTDDTAVFG